MEVITTKNYELVVNAEGDEESPVTYVHIPGMPEHSQLPHIKGSLEMAAELGCRALSPNPPGLHGSKLKDGTGSIEEYRMRHNVNSTYELCCRLVEENPKTKIIIGGNSAGNRSAAYAAAIVPKVVGYFSIFGASTFVRDSNRYARTVLWKERGYEDFTVDDPDGMPEIIRVPWTYAEWASAYDVHLIVPTLKQKKLFMGGILDNVAVPDDIEKQYRLAKEPKELVWLYMDHYCRSADAEKVQSLINDEGLTSLQALKKVLASKSHYSEPESIKKMTNTIADWMIRRQLVPSNRSNAVKTGRS